MKEKLTKILCDSLFYTFDEEDCVSKLNIEKTVDNLLAAGVTVSDMVKQRENDIFVTNKVECKFSELIPGPIGDNLDLYFNKNGWKLERWEEGDKAGYQVFFGKNVQVDNQFEYGFPYLFDKDDVIAFANDFYENKIMVNHTLKNTDDKTLLEEAKKLINNYCLSEFEHEADFRDLYNVGVGYTTITDDEIPIQVSVDLKNNVFKRFLDGYLFELKQYNSLKELINKELKCLDFNELVYVPEDEIAEHIKKTGSLQLTEYGLSLYEHMNDIYQKELKMLGYFEGTCVCEDKITTLEEAAGWYLLTYYQDALYYLGEHYSSVPTGDFYGFKYEDVKSILIKCLDPEKTLDQVISSAESRERKVDSLNKKKDVLEK